MTFSRLRIAWSAVLVTVFGLAGAALPQAAAQPKARGTNAGQAISEKELSAFVRVYVAYQEIRSHYTPALESAKDAPRKTQIEKEANAKLKKVLDANGMSVERYNQIFTAVNGNEALRKRVLNQVKEQRRKSG